ncbi:MAG TPA: protein kinase [Kofleriaceae bacterium]|nr:protein kinase [Kofleriaceae bacterium]
MRRDDAPSGPEAATVDERPRDREVPDTDPSPASQPGDPGEDRLHVRTMPVTAIALARASEPALAASVFDPPRHRFDERAELGRGGMGRVVEAVDRALDRPVAIKHSLAKSATDLARFEREVRITARLQHPGIVPILDAGRDGDGQPFYIMRKIDGEPLAARVDAAKTVRERLALVPAVLGAVDAAAYAHAQSIVHRDIKPWNILLGPFGETLLIDWGLARELDAADEATSVEPARRESAAALTRIGSAYGTPGFMAPEQARGQPVDRRADVYSLGATLYFVLSGKLPLEEPDATLAIRAAARGHTPDLSAIPPEVPVELTAITSKALAIDPARRYADAGELASDLRRFLGGQLVAAHDYSALEHVARWLRKHRLAAAIAAIAVVAIAIVTALSFDRVISERDQARSARALAETRAEEMLVDRARSMVAIDPTSAVALLRGLPAGSSQWPTARQIVRAAVPRGVERALTVHHDRINQLAFSPGGRLASTSLDGLVVVHDLEHGTHQIVARHNAWRAGWLDEHTLVVGEDRGPKQLRVFVIDVDRGTERTIAIDPVEDLVVTRGRFAVRTSAGGVTMFDAELHATGLASDGAELLYASDGYIVAIARSNYFLVAPDGTQHEYPLGISERPYGVRLSDGAQRIAVWTNGKLREWVVGRDAPPREWPQRENEMTAFAYLGQTLYAWTSDRGGVVALDGPTPVLHWHVSGEPLAMSRFADGLAFVSRTGRLAYLDANGTVELAHRTAELVDADVDPAGRRLVTGAWSGELCVIDLAYSRPRMIRVSETSTVVGAAGDRVILADAGHDMFNGTGPSQLAIVDTRSGARTELGSFGFAPFVTTSNRQLIVKSAMQRELTVYDLDGHVVLRVPNVNDTAEGIGLAGGHSVYYVTNDGGLYEQPLEPLGPVRELGRLPVEHGRAGPMVLVIDLTVTPEGLFVSEFDAKTKLPRYRVYDRTGERVFGLGVQGWPRLVGQTSNGSLWFLLDDDLYRQSWLGPAVRVPLGQRVTGARVFDDHVWALSDSLLYDLEPDGRLAHTTSLASTGKDRRRAWLADGFVLITTAGIDVATPSANIRRQLPLPIGAQQAYSSLDGQTVAAIVQRGTEHFLAVWRDPVPADPAAVPAFLSQLTNARLGLGSDAVTWE